MKIVKDYLRDVNKIKQMNLVGFWCRNIKIGVWEKMGEV